MPATAILRPVHVCDRLGVSRSTLIRLRRQADFPRPLQISAQAIGWRAEDIDAWIDARPTA